MRLEVQNVRVPYSVHVPCYRKLSGYACFSAFLCAGFKKHLSRIQSSVTILVARVSSVDFHRSGRLVQLLRHHSYPLQK